VWLAIVFGLWGRGWMMASLAELLREPTNAGHPPLEQIIKCSNLMPGGWLADIPDWAAMEITRATSWSPLCYGVEARGSPLNITLIADPCSGWGHRSSPGWHGSARSTVTRSHRGHPWSCRNDRRVSLRRSPVRRP
jgi:hypothetical protein